MTDKKMCEHCGDARIDDHPEEHPTYCCDCFDLHCGMPIEQLNEERAARGKSPLPPRRR